MNTGLLLNNIEKDVFTRHDLFNAAIKEQDSFKETDMRNLIESLQKNGLITRISHNHYVRNDSYGIKKDYVPVYSDEASEIIADIKEKYPYLSFQVWELSWFNEFLVHLTAHNKIFVDVENDGCEFVYSSLSDKFQVNILLKPSAKELQYYFRGEGVIVERMISESPNTKGMAYETPIEKLIVEMFANKSLMSMISKGDYPYVLENMFEKYNIDQVKMLRYARRRNKEKELVSYINEHTKIDLMRKV